MELPQIVVIGAQSSGKSSVLESIVGKDFLPRGSGIVTRCPLVLQLKKINPNLQEFAEFLHAKGNKFTDFSLVREEIIAQTKKIAGDTKGVTDEAISLTIYSPRVVDLTLVDLPGITKVPVLGQPKDIEVRIKEIVYKFITPQNAVILALTAANTDLANSDAIQMAREVDPHGERTVGVVTKIDLMDEGTDARDLLMGKIYPLKLGYFGIRCRSQKNIDDGVVIAEALEKERIFFEKHPTYCSFTDKLGVPYLTTSLNKILIQHIFKCVPQLHKSIN